MQKWKSETWQTAEFSSSASTADEAQLKVKEEKSSRVAFSSSMPKMAEAEGDVEAEIKEVWDAREEHNLRAKATTIAHSGTMSEVFNRIII